MTGTARSLCLCSSLLVAMVGLPAVLCAPSGVASTASTKADSSVQARPDLSDVADWVSVRDKTICPAQVAYNPELQVLEVWCADGVEGLIFEARGKQYVCGSVRYSINVADVQVDVPGGCVARLNNVVDGPRLMNVDS